MHFALPPRKTSFQPVYARVSARDSAVRRRKTLRYIGYFVFGILTLYLVFSTFGVFTSSDVSSQHDAIPTDSSVVLVTVLDNKTMSDEYIRMIRTNRDDYAARHGYKTYYANTSTYSHLVSPSPSSWSTIPALRHALTLHPTTDYIFSLSPHAVITSPSTSLHAHVFSRLSQLMLRDVPVVPPDSVIHTFSHLRPSQVYLIMSQDVENLAHTSFLLRNTATVPVPHNQPADTWAQYFLDAWFDPLYRAYAFQKAENHALEHIIQWHPTLLAKLALVDQRVLNSYSHKSKPTSDEWTEDQKKHDELWQTGDFVVNLKGCDIEKDRSCEKEMKEYFELWRKEVEQLDAEKSV